MSNQSTKVWQLPLQLFINSWCAFKRYNTENFHTYYTDLNWEKTLQPFWDQDHLKFSKNSSRTGFLYSVEALETDYTFLHHWFDLSLSTLYMFLLTFLICCIELLVLVDFCVNLSSALKLLLRSWIIRV